MTPNSPDQRLIRIGISSCLLGEEVRFDGGHKQDTLITETLGKFFHWVPVCPEVEIGLDTTRQYLNPDDTLKRKAVNKLSLPS